MGLFDASPLTPTEKADLRARRDVRRSAAPAEPVREARTPALSREAEIDLQWIEEVVGVDRAKLRETALGGRGQSEAEALLEEAGLGDLLRGGTVQS